MIVVAACYFLETAWIPNDPGMRVARIRPGAPSGFERAIAADGTPMLLIATGFCGGLDPRLKPGDLILATEIVHRGRRIAIDPELLARAQAGLEEAGIAPSRGPLVTETRVVGTVEEKGKLRDETGAVGVEMEAGRLAEWAEDSGVGFIALKAVLDAADRALPLRRAADALSHPIAAVRAGVVAVRAGRTIGRGIGALAREFAGGAT